MGYAVHSKDTKINSFGQIPLLCRKQLSPEYFQHRDTVPIAIGMELDRESKTGTQDSAQLYFSVTLC